MANGVMAPQARVCLLADAGWLGLWRHAQELAQVLTSEPVLDLDPFGSLTTGSVELTVPPPQDEMVTSRPLAQVSGKRDNALHREEEIDLSDPARTSPGSPLSDVAGLPSRSGSKGQPRERRPEHDASKFPEAAEGLAPGQRGDAAGQEVERHDGWAGWAPATLECAQPSVEALRDAMLALARKRTAVLSDEEDAMQVSSSARAASETGRDAPLPLSTNQDKRGIVGAGQGVLATLAEAALQRLSDSASTVRRDATPLSHSAASGRSSRVAQSAAAARAASRNRHGGDDGLANDASSPRHGTAMSGTPAMAASSAPTPWPSELPQPHSGSTLPPADQGRLPLDETLEPPRSLAQLARSYTSAGASVDTGASDRPSRVANSAAVARAAYRLQRGGGDVGLGNDAPGHHHDAVMPGTPEMAASSTLTPEPPELPRPHSGYTLTTGDHGRLPIDETLEPPRTLAQLSRLYTTAGAGVDASCSGRSPSVANPAAVARGTHQDRQGGSDVGLENDGPGHHHDAVMSGTPEMAASSTLTPGPPELPQPHSGYTLPTVDHGRLPLDETLEPPRSLAQLARFFTTAGVGVTTAGVGVEDDSCDATEPSRHDAAGISVGIGNRGSMVLDEIARAGMLAGGNIDPDVFAELVNEALIEEAERHGVDLA